MCVVWFVDVCCGVVVIVVLCSVNVVIVGGYVVGCVGCFVCC